jgi:hypothetical protein
MDVLIEAGWRAFFGLTRLPDYLAIPILMLGGLITGFLLGFGDTLLNSRIVALITTVSSNFRIDLIIVLMPIPHFTEISSNNGRY